MQLNTDLLSIRFLLNLMSSKLLFCKSTELSHRCQENESTICFCLTHTHALYLKHSIQTTGHIRLTCCTNPVHHSLWNLILLHVKHHIYWLRLRHVTQQFHVRGEQTNYFLLETCLIKLCCSWRSSKSTGTLLTAPNQGIVFPLDWKVYCHVPLHLMLKKWNSSSGVHRI